MCKFDFCILVDTKRITYRIYHKICKLLGRTGIQKYGFVRSTYESLTSNLVSDFIEFDGHKMFLPPNDPHLAVDGIPEQFELYSISKLIQKGDVVMDLGANIGIYTLSFAKLVGETGKVFSFEPEPNNFSILKKNIETNGYRNVIFEQKAVSNITGKLSMYLSDTYTSQHTIYYTENNRRSIDIDGIRIDDYFKNYDLQINFIKMDVEGAELAVIQGMSELLQKTKNIIIMTEFNPKLIKKFGKEPKEYLDVLLQHGFKIYDLDAQEKKIVDLEVSELLQKYTPENKTLTNLLCIKGKPRTSSYIQLPQTKS